MSLSSLTRAKILATAEAILDLRLQRGYHIWRDLRFWAKRLNYDTSVILDVGANIGQTAEEAHIYFPHSKIHCFEFVPETFDALSQKDLPYVVANKIALSDAAGATNYITGSDSLLNRIQSQAPIKSGKMHSVRTTPVSTVDIYCDSVGLERVFLLKTDTEGHDVNVLKGASNLLNDKKVAFIYSECRVNPGNQQTDFLALCEFMISYGYDFVGLYEPMHVNGSYPALNYANALFSRGTSAS